ncbi:MAG TPA: 50S ribosomal protein L11 methyltransferase [Burkholderiales bacterium]|nr:50S ribosomal protein L11 methyltransferase [Burkholderiales bacterium]
MPWLAISLEMDPAPADALSEALIEAGADSVALEPAGERVRVDVLADEGADAGALLAAAAQAAALPLPAFRTARVADEDWVRRSQAQFGPIRVAPNLWIVPSWHEPPDPSARVLRIDPGLAFGTGSHPSTRLILNFLEKGIQPGQRVLDYGCGSGILAIAAALLGAGEVDATDTDPQALETTSANAARNGVAVRVAAPDRLPPGTYDLVLANILAGPLIALAPQLAGRTRAGGRIALSGILEAQAGEVLRAYAPDFAVAVHARDDGWALVAGERR